MRWILLLPSTLTMRRERRLKSVTLEPLVSNSIAYNRKQKPLTNHPTEDDPVARACID